MNGLTVRGECPACGSVLSHAGGSEDLCPACLLELALESPSLMAELDGQDDEETLAYEREALSPGQILGKRYRIRSLLGRGGMGEVWRASDLKLRVDVALKALLPRLLESDRALETLRQEVRVAREVISPNVCRVFDLVELDGQELVSMEYIDGVTLLDILRARAPLDLTEAREIAAQFLAGLQAIHDADLVHRDVKPENLMMTRSGRVVLMDFGIAKGLAEAASGTISGTPAYMSPEQSRGEVLDARADVFSAGVVLAEMVAPGGLRTSEARQELWRGIHHEPPQIAESPWTSVLCRAVASSREQRYDSAAVLARALEEVTLRVAGAEDVRPYPGLAAFSEDDSEYFFGRELEVEEMWKKLQRPQLLGLIGPSGAGKSSFLRAGLLPVILTGWRGVLMTPGSRPMSALAQALVPELTGDTEALQLLAGHDDEDALLGAASRWRRQHDETLLIVDQFEELFTQSPPDVQARFSDLLARLALEADVHVLLSMRDDFLSYCSHQESLKPIFSELTALKPLTGTAVRRALVQPAAKCGYQFEDDSLVDEMVAEVGGERGALPMLAFASSRLWDYRDREGGLLTRAAYDHIGGVGGALAQHAETTIETIGQDRVPMVRELFRNLVTAQGTRAARERQELLSVFGDADTDAEGVLDALIDARLLTSYEVPGDEDEGATHQRVEIVHESLLSNWPRLVRWQTQDADSAQLRDQIRQAAQMWEERGRPEDLLWTGTSFGEYRLWRERYEGGLSTAEEAFGNAMVYRAERQKRRRRFALSAALAVLLLVLGVISWFGWHAELERRRAEASRLLTLAELELETYPTAALAWATKSLEIADSPEGRMMALRALQESPPGRFAQEDPAQTWWSARFSPSGDWIAHEGTGEVYLRHRGGGEAIPLVSNKLGAGALRIAFQNDDVLVVDRDGDFRWLSVPEGEELRRVTEDRGRLSWPGGGGYFSVFQATDHAAMQWFPFGDGDRRLVGTMPNWQVADIDAGGVPWESPVWSPEWSAIDIDPSGTWLAYSRGRTVSLRSLQEWSRAPVKLGEHESNVVEVAIQPDGEFVAAIDEGGDLRVWTRRGWPTEPWRTYRADGLRDLRFGHGGRWLAAHGAVDGVVTAQCWDLRAPLGAEPLTLKRNDNPFASGLTFHPSRSLLVTSHVQGAAFWPLPEENRWVLPGHEGRVEAVAFTPDGEWLISAAGDGVRAWPLANQNRGNPRILLDRPLIAFTTLAVDPSGESVAVGTRDGSVVVVPLAGGQARELPGRWANEGGGMFIDFSPDGRRLAATPVFGTDLVIRVWDLVSDEVKVLDSLGTSTRDLTFVDPERLHWAGNVGTIEGDAAPGERVIDLERGSVTEVPTFGSLFGLRAYSHDGSYLLSVVYAEARGQLGEIVRRDLETGEERRILTHDAESGADTNVIAIDPSDRWIVTGDWQGLVRVGPVSGEDSHLLFGHQGLVRSVAVSPDGERIASGAEDGTVRVWATPDLSERPLHTLPHDELITRLQSLTNLRLVADPESSTGWRIAATPFSGWAEVPER